MSDHSNSPNQKRDWKISITLAAVWIIALAILSDSGLDIPASMLAIATVFFLLLIPAMNDLVRSIDRAAAKWLAAPSGKHSSGGKHE